MVDEDVTEELPVTFHPPLYVQRRGWVFEQMRREGVTEVVDIGCGEGETIACLCNPAPWLGPLRLDCKDGSPLPVEDLLHIQSIHGLDVSASELDYAASAAAERAETSWMTRWEPLHVSLWHGGLECFNAAFVGAECMISTEVIEHLPEDILPEFAPMLLGVYHPRLLLITTPSYDFNARFTAPDAPLTARRGFPDPTGRTSRIFRHNDHKFEWTRQEFREWCEAAASTWGYDVEISGVGRAQETDKWGRDADLGSASQVAAFRRRDDEHSVRSRAEKSQGALHKASARPAHTLVTSLRHNAFEMMGEPTLTDISGLVKQKMQQWQEAGVTIHQLWFDGVDQVCGGDMGRLIQALEEDPSLSVSCNGTKVLEWSVVFHDIVLIAPEEDTEPYVTIKSGTTSDSERDEVQTPPDDCRAWQATTMDAKEEQMDWVDASQTFGEDNWGVAGWADGCSSGTGWGEDVC